MVYPKTVYLYHELVIDRTSVVSRHSASETLLLFRLCALQKWGGCGDDTDYAYGFSYEFIDANEKGNRSRNRRETARRNMNLHNNEAGRLVSYVTVGNTYRECRIMAYHFESDFRANNICQII